MKIAMVAVVAAVAGTVTYQNQTKEVVMSELALANVEKSLCLNWLWRM